MKKNPYTALLERAKQYAFDVKYRHRTHMFTYPKAAQQDCSYRLDELYQRVAAADQLGYDAQITTKDGALIVQYVKRVTPPYEFAPD
jgi:hypothetical protein